MEYFIIFLVSFFSSVIGAICGIGGGVIIKPVLDATGILAVTTVSFLSGCTVLSMSVVSMYKNLRAERSFSFDRLFALVIAAGSVAGGLCGKAMYQWCLGRMPDTSRVGAVQAAVLLVITVGTLFYTLQKKRIKTQHLTSRAAIFLIGVMLGMLSSFLGIGGGPINMVALFYLFSMEFKQAAMYSIFIILFSQISSLLCTVLEGNVPEFGWSTLLLMIACGILGGCAGSRLNKKLEDGTTNRLFIGLMSVIIVINIYNIYRYL